MPKKVIDIFPPTSTKAFKDKLFSLPYKTKKFWSLKKKIIFLFFLALVSVFCLLHFVFSEVRIEIWPETELLDFEEKITADFKKENANDLVLSKTIPAHIIDTGEMITSQSFPSSGKISKESKAYGKIKIFSSYNLPITLTVNTRFQAPEENVLYFRSTKAVTVPAKGTLEIDVVADRPGEEYNIEPATFSVPGLVGSPEYMSVHGKSFSKMAGGFKGEIEKVEKEDLEIAKNILVGKLFSEARESLKNKAGNEFILLDGVTKEEILDASSSVEVGDEVEYFDFKVTVKSQALVFKKIDLENFAKEFILSRAQDGKKIQESSLRINYSSESVNLNIGKIVLKLVSSATIYSDINISSLKESLKGKPLKEAQDILEGQDQVKKVQIISWPPWVKNVPKNGEKIKIKLTIDPALISP